MYRPGVWHNGLMLESKQLVVSIARRVFPGMGPFSEGLARLGQWDAYLVVEDGVAWLTVQLGLDALFRIEARGRHVKAEYALPAVVESGHGEKEYGTAWADSRHWRVDEWSDVFSTAADIRKFFNNYEEFCRAETEVYKILGSS